MARPLDRLTLTSTIAYLDARYDVYFDDVGGSLRGNRLPNAPQWNVTLGGEYKAPLGDGTLSLRTDVSWRHSAFSNPHNTPLLYGNAPTLVTGRVACHPGSGACEIPLYGLHLTDDRSVSYSTSGRAANGDTKPYSTEGQRAG